MLKLRYHQLLHHQAGNKAGIALAEQNPDAVVIPIHASNVFSGKIDLLRTRLEQLHEAGERQASSIDTPIPLDYLEPVSFLTGSGKSRRVADEFGRPVPPNYLLVEILAPFSISMSRTNEFTPEHRALIAKYVAYHLNQIIRKRFTAKR